MDPNQQPAANATKAEADLAAFVAEHRQHLPQLPERVDVHAPFLHVEEGFFDEQCRKAAERAELRRKAELRARFAELCMAAGDRYARCTLENFDAKHPKQKQVLTEVLAYVAADCPGGLVLYGPIGTGKDHLAFAVCRECIRSGKTVKWLNGRQWFGSIRDAMDSTKTEAAIIDEVRRPDVVCLSDPLPPIGALTPHQADMLYRFIDARYCRGATTICTLNVENDADADERLGVPTWDRLCDGSCKLHCSWASCRKPVREVR